MRRNIYNEKIHEGDQLFLFGEKEVITTLFKDDIHIMEENINNQNHTPLTKPHN